MSRIRDVSLANGEKFQFVISKKMKKQIQLICIERGIEMAQYIRESIKKNNRSYKYLIRKIK
jgi:hypothetical protein